MIFTEKDDFHGPPSPIMKRTNSAEYRDVEVRDIYLRRSKVTGKIFHPNFGASEQVLNYN